MLSKTMTRRASIILLLAGSGAMGQSQPADPIAASLPVDGAMVITIVRVDGEVQVRDDADGSWRDAKPQMTLGERAEVRTNIRSAIELRVGDSQVVTVGSLTTWRSLQAEVKDGVNKTDSAMPYGQVRVRLEASDRANDAQLRTPNSKLGVRGTVFEVYDRPPFTPLAISYEGRVNVRDLRRQVSIGSRGGGVVKLAGNRDSAAQTGLGEATQRPRGDSAGTSLDDSRLAATSANFQQLATEVGGIFAIIATAQNQATLDSLAFTGVRLGNPARFGLEYSGVAGSDINLIVTPFQNDVPIDRITTPENASIRSVTGAMYVFDSGPLTTAVPSGTDRIEYNDETIPAPNGIYEVRAVLASGTSASGTLLVQPDFRVSGGDLSAPVNLSTASPSSTVRVNLQNGVATPARRR